MGTKILGLDLGTNSIGWAVIDKENEKILDTGVRIFPEGLELNSIGKGDKEQSKNKTRRDNRQMRRQFYRKRLRKIKLLEALIDQQMCPLKHDELNSWKKWDRQGKAEARKFPNSEKFAEWIKLNPYDLREKAITEQVSHFELGRILYHMIQRRGFLSNRKEKKDPASMKIFTTGNSDENILPISKTKEKIANSSLGSYLKSITPVDGEPFRQVTDENGSDLRARGRYTSRDMYISEFEKIWQTQKAFSDIDRRSVEARKVRELKGDINGSRNRKKIAHLWEKYGNSNVTIGEKDSKGVTKVTTLSRVPLKQFLAGNIKEVENENGEKMLQFKSNESVLFWQRPLRSQKELLSNCKYENQLPVINADGKYLKKSNGDIQTRSKKPCALSHPEFELFRAHKFINNIKYGIENRPLNREQKTEVLALINSKAGNFNFSEIPKKLSLTYEKFNYNDTDKVPGSTTIKQLKPLFDTQVWENSYKEIWHCFYNYEDSDKLLEKLQKDYGFKKGLDTVEKINLKDGYCNISLKAIRNMHPFLEKGYMEDRAAILGGVKNAFGKKYLDKFNNHADSIERDIIDILNEKNEDGEAIEKIRAYLSSPIYSYGFSENDPRFSHLYHHSRDIETEKTLSEWVPEVENLRNPVVQQGINETRRLVNSLMRKYRKQFGKEFRFDLIKVEMGRDLRNNKKGRQEMYRKNRDNEKKNDEARECLRSHGLQPLRSNIHKFLLFKEIEEKSGKAACPYTGKTISIAQLLGDHNHNDSIQIEHIIPRSVSLDDSFGNKTLCEANFNREKGEKTPWQFYCENSDPNLWNASSWEEVKERAFSLLPYPKAKRFTSKKELESSSFIERQLNDSRYIARKSVELLSHICDDVRVMPGRLTAELRHLWGLNSILQPVKNIDKHSFDFNNDNAISCYSVVNKEDEVLSVHPKTNPRPETSDSEILIPGRISKNRFSSKLYKVELQTPDLKDGNYWAKFKVSGTAGLVPMFNKKPQIDEKSIVLKGSVDNEKFKSDTIKNVEATEPEGKYWARFEIEDKKFEEPQKSKQPRFSKKNQILLYGTVTGGEFKSYIYRCSTNLPDGNYWIVLTLNTENTKFTRILNDAPEINGNQLLITATVDDSGELSADEDKGFNMETSEESGKYYATLNIESATPDLHKMDNPPPETGKGERVVEGNIWADSDTGDIKFDPVKNREDHRHHAIDAITIALTERGFLQRLSTENARREEKKRGNFTNSTEKYPEPWQGFVSDAKNAVETILTSHKKSYKGITKNRKGYSVRGPLHKDTVYGKRQAPGQEEGFHQRVKITSLENNKHIGKIVDKTIQKLVRDHLQDKLGIDVANPKGFKIPKDAFFKDGKWRLSLCNKKGGERVPIKKVRIKKTIGNAVKLKSDINQHVNPQNNHHTLIYKDSEGNLHEDVVLFWTAVERKLQKMPVYQMPRKGKEIVTVMEINDMFLLGISDEEFEANRHNYRYLSKHLYRVQKCSSGNYNFRHHLASTINNDEQLVRISSFKSWEKVNPIKVKVNELGEIVEAQHKECGQRRVYSAHPPSKKTVSTM